VKVTYFVNAMLLFEGNSNRILCDPWITFNESSRSGLYNFPPTNLSRDDVRAIRPDYVYISHTHADHFDPETLELLDKETRFIVAQFKNNFTERNLRKMGFKGVEVVDPVNGLQLTGDDHVWIQPSATYPEVDSVAGFRIDGCTIFNANDNPHHEAQSLEFRKMMGSIDLCCVPFAFQGPYPAFYENLSDEEKAHEASKKRWRGYAHVANFARDLSPKWLLAFAAGALYGGSKAKLHPFYGVGTAREAVLVARQTAEFEPVFMSEGVSLELPSGRVIGNYKERDHATESAYIERVSQSAGPFDAGGSFWIDPRDRIDLTPLLTSARRRQDEWATRTGRWTNMSFYIDVGANELYRMRLGDPLVSRVAEAKITDPAYEIFRVPYPLMVGLLTRHFNWSNVKTQFVSFYRKPNVFDADLHILMSYLQV
jgi:hypothetical protein